MDYSALIKDIIERAKSNYEEEKGRKEDIVENLRKQLAEDKVRRGMASALETLTTGEANPSKWALMTTTSPANLNQLITQMGVTKNMDATPKYETDIMKSLMNYEANKEKLDILKEKNELEKKKAGQLGFSTVGGLNLMYKLGDNIQKQFNEPVKDFGKETASFLDQAIKLVNNKNLSAGDIETLKTGLYKFFSHDVGNVTVQEAERVGWESLKTKWEKLRKMVDETRLDKAPEETRRRLAFAMMNALGSTIDAMKKVIELRKNNLLSNPLISKFPIGEGKTYADYVMDVYNNSMEYLDNYKNKMGEIANIYKYSVDKLKNKETGEAYPSYEPVTKVSNDYISDALNLKDKTPTQELKVKMDTRTKTSLNRLKSLLGD